MRERRGAGVVFVLLALASGVCGGAELEGEDPIKWTPPEKLPELRERVPAEKYAERLAAARAKLTDALAVRAKAPEHGAEVKTVVPGSPAEAAGMVAGDVCIRLNGKAII